MEGVHGKLINVENEWDHRISAGAKEGPADCIRIDEVAAALKKMKRQSPRLGRASRPVDGTSMNEECETGLVAEMIQTTEDIGTQWILDL